MRSETWRDIGLAMRTLRGSPLFTLTAVLSLAIGIGSTAVIFGVADAYLFRPWPGIGEPERLVEIGRIDMEGPGPSTADGFSTFSYANPNGGGATLTDLTAVVLLPHRLASWLAAAAALVGAFLAAIGIYGLASYTVSQRRREIGVRMALGALRAQIVRVILATATRPVVVGAALGLVASLLATRLLAGMLYGVQPLDPLSFIGGPVIFMAVAVLASVMPARRAASVNPVDALRAE